MNASSVRIAAAASGAIALGAVSYALYFDYRRRNDPVFRKNLHKEKKKVAKVSQQQAEQGRTQILGALRRALALINSEPVPTDVAEKEQYFMEQVGFGEQLAARSPEHYVASAISFYRALKVYPAPHELIMIYQKTQPPIVFDLVMELISLDVPPSSTDPRDSTSEALLTEIEPEDRPTPAAAPSTETTEEVVEDTEAATTSPATGSENGSAPSTGSFVQVEHEETPEPVAAVVVVEETVVVEVEPVVEAQAEVEVEASPELVAASTEDPPEEPAL
ncbi:hypothetical protein P7C70_g1452, partial [Phenoliferia sp. Uapishka_3]